MESLITPELIQELKEFLIEHPPDPAYDEEAEYLDGKLPPQEFKSRCAYGFLESLGELPEELKRK